jgi:hypothetical protein
MAAAQRSSSHDESAIANAQWAAFWRAYHGRHDQYVREADKFQNFYCDNQWDEAAASKLENEGKPVLTINVSKKTINAVKGTYGNTRPDIIFKPKKNAADEQARTLTHLVEHILQTNKYKHIEAAAALDGWVMDRGYLDVRMNFETNVLGDVEISDIDPRDVIPDPDAKDYDPDKWAEFFVIRWKSLDDIDVEFGPGSSDKIRALVSVTGQTGTYGSQSIRFGDTPGGTGTRIYVPGATRDEENRIRAVRVIERQYKKMAKVQEFVDVESGDVSEVPSSWDKGRAREVAKQYGLVLRSRMKQRIRWTVTADQIVLHDDWSPYEHFTIVPYFPYFMRGTPTGIMRSLISPQEQLNKTESQELHIINTTANSGWMVQAGSLVNMTNEELEERGAETGIVIVYGSNKEPPQKIQPNTIPTGIDRVSQKSYQYITEIPGIGPIAGPTLSSEISGVAMQQATSSSLSTLRPVFDSLNYTRELLADRLVSCVQRFFTEARIFRITDWRHPEQPEIDVEINTSVLNDVTLGEYSVQASDAPAQDTLEDREFAQIIEMRNAGVETIPDYHVVLASNLRNKQVIAEESKKLQGLAEPSPEEAEMQAQMADLQLRQLMAEVAKLEAEAQKLMADGQLAGAKAEVAIAGENRMMQTEQFNQQFDQHKLRADMAKAAANLMNKLELAGVHVQAKEGITRYTTQSKLMDAHMERGTKIELAKLKPRPAPKPAKPKKAAR